MATIPDFDTLASIGQGDATGAAPRPGRLPSTMLAPRSIAVIGASDDRGKVGGRPIHYMSRFGFRGSIYPVNPRRQEVQGLRCYSGIADLPETPDMAVIAVAASAALAALRECGERGIGTAVVMSSGFGEIGAGGKQLQEQLVGVARQHGMRMLGPNAQGMANFRSGAVANFSTMFMEVPPEDGPVAILSQSGAASVMPYALLRERRIGVRYVVASGNDADVTIADLLSSVTEDDGIRIVLLYLEALGDVQALAAAAERARARGIVLVAIKAGSSGKGAAAAASHTGALATEDAVVSAFFRRHGIWRARTIQELAATVPLYLSRRSPGDGRLLVVSHSGAVGVMCADAAERLSLPVPDLAPATRERLLAIVPSFGSVQNPVDLTAGLMTDNSLFARALGALAADPGVDVVQVGMPVAGEGYDLDGFAEAAAAVGVAEGKLVVVSGPQRAVLDVFARRSLPTFQDDAAALAAVRQLVDHRRLLSKLPTAPGPAKAVRLPMPGAAATLSEADSLAVLASVGVPVVSHHVCGSLDEARRAFDGLAGRCVVKACSADAPHKSELGLVWLNVTTRQALDDAYSTCVARMAASGIAGTVIVARMEAGLRELAVGARRDPVFGPVVLLGDGGKYVEVLKDYALLLPPFAIQDAVDALRTLRIWPILQGARGEPAADLDGVSAIAVAVGELMRAAPDIESIDLNPVMVQPQGGGAIVVDALVTRMPGAVQ